MELNNFINFEIPEDFEGLNLYNGLQSSAGLVTNDAVTNYFMRALYQRILSGTKFGLPVSWNQGKRYFKNVLFINGFIGVINHAVYGKIPQIAAPKGHGLFLQPTDLLVNQPLVENWSGKIGVDCEVIHLTPDWRGVIDIVFHYAKRLSVAVTSLDVSLINSRLAFIAAAKTKSAAQTLKFLYEKISAGSPFEVFDELLKGNDECEDPIWSQAFNVGQNYISDKLLADIDTIMRQFDNEVGILALNGKKERMITDEVTALNDDACARSSCWFEELSDSFDRVNRLFPELKLTFTMRYGGENYVYIPASDSDRSI